jgi:DNA-binding LacI/PurR family transcriptional regulator
MPVSIKDIARSANVSYSTVSRALAHSPRVKAETRDRIQQLALEMGYSPSAVARSLVTNRTRTIGIIATTITDLFQAEIIQAIQRTALRHNHSVILTQSGPESERELAELEALRERRVDGIILISIRAAGEYASVLQGSGIPLVFINDPCNVDYGHSLKVDSFAGACEAVRHLLDLGHRSVAYIAGPSANWDNDQRLAGYQETLRANDLPVQPALIVGDGRRAEDGIRSMQQLLRLPSPPTAVFCYDDTVALGAIRAVHGADLRVPQDMSVVGFDDVHLASYFEPPLTTIAQPKREMGQKAVEMVLAVLRNAEKVEDCVMPVRLVVRESTMPPRHLRKDRGLKY